LHNIYISACKYVDLFNINVHDHISHRLYCTMFLFYRCINIYGLEKRRKKSLLDRMKERSRIIFKSSQPVWGHVRVCFYDRYYSRSSSTSSFCYSLFFRLLLLLKLAFNSRRESFTETRFAGLFFGTKNR